MSSDASSAAAAGSSTGVDGYEFQASEEGVIRDLAGAMRGAARASMVLGVLNLVLGAMRLWGGRMLGGIEGLGTALVAILGALWVLNAAKSFQLVVDTKGNDIKNTLNAVVGLRRMFMLGAIACVALIVLLVGETSVAMMSHHRARQQQAEQTTNE